MSDQMELLTAQAALTTYPDLPVVSEVHGNRLRIKLLRIRGTNEYRDVDIHRGSSGERYVIWSEVGRALDALIDVYSADDD